jgi:phosphoribosylformylglycinamidine cyclo-ligase
MSHDHPAPTSLSYRDAGVDIDAGDALVERIKRHAKRTARPEVLAGIGGFGALFGIPRGYREPVLVAGTDGVGTKLKLAFELGRHDGIGQDLVAMSVNDILVQGAEPLFFLDYFACGKLDVDVAERVVAGIAHGCELAGCALIGGETAEMPGMYPAGEYDLAGFAVGIVERDAVIDGRHIQPGDAVIGLASSGAHSNGYSLIRKILERSGRSVLSEAFGDGTLADTLMAPTRIYVRPVLELFRAMPGVVKGLAHITGGGLRENLPRILSAQLAVRLDPAAWPRPALFDWLQREGGVAEDEMLRVFNCGIGLALVAAEARAAEIVHGLTTAGERAWQIGRVIGREQGMSQVLY